MSNINRWIEGHKNAILVTVASGVTVEIGDLMFLNNADNLLNDGSSIADYFAYPISYLRTSGASLELNKAEVKERFLGVALDDNYEDDIPITECKVPVAKSGKFEFDLKPGATVHVGDAFGPSGTTTASDMYNQKIAKTTTTALTLGYFAEYKVNANSAEVWLKTAFV